MRVICNKCKKRKKRTMNSGEVAIHLGAYFGKMLIPFVLKEITVNVFKDYWSTPTPTKGFFDDTLAGTANFLEIECPDCKNKACWDPYPEIDDIVG